MVPTVDEFMACMRFMQRGQPMDGLDGLDGLWVTVGRVVFG